MGYTIHRANTTVVHRETHHTVSLLKNYSHETPPLLTHRFTLLFNYCLLIWLKVIHFLTNHILWWCWVWATKQLQVSRLWILSLLRNMCVWLLILGLVCVSLLNKYFLICHVAQLKKEEWLLLHQFYSLHHQPPTKNCIPSGWCVVQI